MYYDGYHFGGMHLMWWFIWGVMLFWIFFTPYTIPGQGKKKGSALDILNRRLASGEIKNEEYTEKKKLMEAALTK